MQLYGGSGGDGRLRLLLALVLAVVLAAALAPSGAQAVAGLLVTIVDSITNSKARVEGGKLRVGDGLGPLTIDGSAAIKDTGGDKINSRNMGTLGDLNAPGSDGALDVRTLSGGGGLLGLGDCDLNDAPPDRPNETTIAANNKTVVTALLVTGDDANVTVTFPELVPTIGPGPVNNFRSTTAAPNALVTFGNGLTVTPSSMKFECTAVGGGAGSGDFLVIGQ
jgi:hypothetical protein